LTETKNNLNKNIWCIKFCYRQK